VGGREGERVGRREGERVGGREGEGGEGERGGMRGVCGKKERKKNIVMLKNQFLLIIHKI
jgi:hypothetical protein